MTQRRAVFDIGSGQIKFQISDVNLLNNQIIKNVYSENVQCLFIADAKKNNMYMSDKIMQKGFDQMEYLNKISREKGVQKSYGISTEAFRKSKNGVDFIEKLQKKSGFDINIISQEKEAKYGFLSASALSDTKMDEKCEMISWDCGAGSFQMTQIQHFNKGNIKYQSYSDGWGSGTITHQAQNILKDVQKNINPFQKAYQKELLDVLLQELREPPTWAKKSQQVIAVGTDQSIFNQQRILNEGKQLIKQQDVEKSLEMCGVLDDQSLYQLELQKSAFVKQKFDINYNVSPVNAMYIMPKLCLLLGVMKKCEIQEVEFYQTNGHCAALLLDQQLWK